MKSTLSNFLPNLLNRVHFRRIWWDIEKCKSIVKQGKKRKNSDKWCNKDENNFMEERLIELYCTICQCNDSRFIEGKQRLSNNNCPQFSDEELITVYLWRKAQQFITRKTIYNYTKSHLSTCFQRCPVTRCFAGGWTGSHRLSRRWRKSGWKRRRKKVGIPIVTLWIPALWWLPDLLRACLISRRVWIGEWIFCPARQKSAGILTDGKDF